MRPTLAVLALVAAGVMTACDAPNLSGPNDPSGLQLRLAVIKNHTDSPGNPWSFSETNPCNVDLASGTGLADYHIDTSLYTNGATTYHSEVNGNGTGTGAPSGKKYKVNLHSTYVSNVASPPPAYSVKQQDTWTVTGPTSKDSYKRLTT